MSLTLVCVEGNIVDVSLALYGNQAGACPAWSAPPGACNDAGFLAYARSACLGQRNCTLSTAGRPDPCEGRAKSVAAVARCSAPAGGFSPTPAPPLGPEELIRHPVVVDCGGGLLSWLQPAGTAFSQFMERSLVWFYNSTCPHDPQTGLPYYYVHGQYPKVAQETVPARQVAWGVEGALAVFAFNGNRRALDEMAAPFASYVASFNGTAPSPWAWAGAAFACGNPEELVFRGYNASRLNGNGSGDGYMILEPDKAADAALAFATLYQVSGDSAWLTAALGTADALVRNRVPAPDATHSPWPFRVHAATGAVLEYYCANVWPALRLFDALGDVARVSGSALVPRAQDYAQARADALAWALDYPLTNMAWQGQWEDMIITPTVGTNINSYGPSKAAAYLLDHREGAAGGWLNLTRGLLDFIWAVFVEEYSSAQDPPLQWGAPAVAEQTFDRMKMGCHTAHWAAVAARFANETANATLAAGGGGALNWATYTLLVDNTSLVCTGDANDWFPIHAVMPAYFAAALAATPQLSSANESHIYRSTSPLRAVSYYSSSALAYTTYDPAATMWATLAGEPAGVAASGRALPRVPPGGAGGAPEGWWSAAPVQGAWGGTVWSVIVHTESGGGGVEISM
jgi:hypothetical protein